MNKSANTFPVHATLLVAPGCPHCSGMKQILSDMFSRGVLASFDIIDVSKDSEMAEKFAVRSVPWLKLNMLELQGAHSKAELQNWVAQAARPDGLQALFESLLSAGQIGQVESMLRRNPQGLSDLLVLFADPTQQINVRLGASAVLESLEGSGLLEQAVDEIVRYTHHEQASTRLDACHVLSFVNHPAAMAALQQALTDTDPEVREVAAESLTEKGGQYLH